ncbi:winged helix-turn-helix domain-containing protein [Bacteroides faecium]|uniref:Uncharacterized protein n=1 Tax=Bacteroides faecium TaxID=2715212 RepID=A0A6H0KLN0_9BACE|nr:hypothetical protein [Bacteroides faecium]QIU94195.1 hypothetical protein BacF7301_08560 [Bacteroides faecium]
MSFVRNLNKTRYWITLGCVYLIIKSIYTIYQDKTERWCEQATLAFEDILQQEIQKHDTISMSYGRYINNKEKRSLFSPVLVNIPLNVDSLNKMWRESLYNVNIPVKTNVRISISKGQVHYSESSFAPLAKDSLFSFYLGPNHEVEITGFASYHWWNIFDGRLPIMIILLLAGYFIPGFLFVKVLQMPKLSLFKKQIPTSKDEKAADVIVKAERLPVYQLEEDVFFDVHQRILKKKEDIEKLTPQQAVLLEAFLKANQYKLTQREIDILLWPNGSGTAERLYTAICRLRKSLEGISSFQVECQIDIYQLKKSNSAKEHEIIVLDKDLTR